MRLSLERRIGYLQTASMLLILSYYLPVLLSVVYPTWVTLLFGALLFSTLILRSYYGYKINGSYSLLLFVSILAIVFFGFLIYGYFA